MKLKISFRPENALRVTLNADMKNADLQGKPWTCGSLFLDFGKTPHARGYELKKWKIRRDRDKWNGTASEASPELKDGDEVTFYAARSN